MGSCTKRHFLLSVCILQLLTIIERQVFDFLGFMWAPILVNFFHIIFVIFGFFGAYQLRAKYIIIYSTWNVLWIGWNIFLVCFYLNVGILDRDSDILNLGTGSVSWFESNGIGCIPNFSINITADYPTYRPVRPDSVDGCLLDYHIVEVVHSALQIMLAVLALLGSILMAKIFIDDDDHFERGTLKSKHRQSLYSIEFSSPVDAIRGHTAEMGDGMDMQGAALSPKPMTPRRVKRRSVMTRGATNRQSSSSRRSHSNNRSSTRTSRRKYQHPVTKIMEQQSTGQLKPPHAPYPTPQDKLSLTESNVRSFTANINQSQPNNLNMGSQQGSNHNTYQNYSFHHPKPKPDPIYYNMSASTTTLQQTWNNNNTANGNSQGHFNPTYQHSNPNLSYSPDHNEEYYTNRPPSVRSSYSNFHGARHLSSYNMPGATENVFAGLSGQLNQQHSSGAAQPQAIPQVPSRAGRSASRESVRSMAFLNNGPPAYNLNYHTPPDSETTM